ncbi:MAG: hypothetical protein HFG68_03150 [Hungatella sp.]|nr:hypothetical protein [Hungatella sp.]
MKVLPESLDDGSLTVIAGATKAWSNGLSLPFLPYISLIGQEKRFLYGLEYHFGMIKISSLGKLGV